MANGTRKILPDTENRARKRSREPQKWKREETKIARHSPKGLPEFPRCGHRGNNQPYYCLSLCMNDVRDFHAVFYYSKKKTEQDSFILRYCSGVAPERKRSRQVLASKPKSISITYKVRKQDKTNIQVCREAFLGILGIKKDRVIRLVKKCMAIGEAPKENRGGDRVKNKNDDKKKNIKKFVESLKCTESHYCRSDTPYRVYLPCDLNIVKLWKMYNSQATPEHKVKSSFFRNYFNKNYNIGFGTPQTDLCSTCLRYKEQIKKCSDANSKQTLITNNRVHKMQAKSFFNLLKQDTPEVTTFSFDCEKNLQIPKLPDQQAYFSMQVNFYNFAVVGGNSKSKLLPENVSCYVWTEVERPKGSNEIASAVYHTLRNYEFPPDSQIVRLFCDDCGGQNKNSIFIGMLCYWFTCSAPPHLKEIHIIFPVVGHSFIPPDRVFGNIEKIVRKTPVVIKPDDYIDIIKERATIFKVGVDYKIFDWKSETQKVLKPTTQWHFKFKPAKRFILTKSDSGMVLVRGEAVYRSDLGEGKGIYKKGKKIEAIKLKELPVGVRLKVDKVKSIDNLLKAHYGNDWESSEELQYFKELFRSNLENVEREEDNADPDNDDEELTF